MVNLFRLFEEKGTYLGRIVRDVYRLLMSDTECSIYNRVDISVVFSVRPLKKYRDIRTSYMSCFTYFMYRGTVAWEKVAQLEHFAS